MNNIKNKIELIQYITLICIALFLPYFKLYEIVIDLSIILFITTILLGKFRLKEILFNKIFLLLSIFILFTYLSILWSGVDNPQSTEKFFNIMRFKYYFFIIPGIYFSSLTTKKINNIFLISALSPAGIALLYYSNVLGITDVYSFMINGNSNLIMHYLYCNFFIMFSSIYFTLLSIYALKNKNYYKFFIFISLTLFFVISMVIDPKTTARLTIFVYLITLLLMSIIYLKKKHMIIVALLIISISAILLSNNTRIIAGFKSTITAIEKGAYNGSWGHRVGFAIVGLKIFEEHPLAGMGIANVRERTIIFANNNPKYFYNDKARHFHNEHINILVQVGIIGYILFLSFIYIFIKLKINDRFFNSIKTIYIIAFLFMMLGEHYLSMLNTSLYFAFITGLIILYHKIEVHKVQI